MANGILLLLGLGAITWLGYWAAQEGRTGLRRWSPFDWKEDSPKTDAAPPAAGWRQRRTPPRRGQ